MIRHTQLHLFDTIDSNGCSQAQLDPPEVNLNTKSAILNLQYVKTELSYNADFLHIGRLQRKQ